MQKKKSLEKINQFVNMRHHPKCRGYITKISSGQPDEDIYYHVKYYVIMIYQNMLGVLVLLNGKVHHYYLYHHLILIPFRIHKYLEKRVKKKARQPTATSWREL